MEELITGGDKRFGGIRRGKSYGLIFAFACVAMFAGGCSKSEPDKADNGATFDSSRLPRVSGATEVFASPATTIFTSVAKAGIMPKPGQAKVLFGNINPAEAAITFNGKTLKVAAGAGTKAPDGPSFDLPPGKYKYSIKLPGQAAQSDEVEIAADETWGLMIGPGGVLALQAY